VSPDEASPVSKSESPALAGVSRRRKSSMKKKRPRSAAGAMKTIHCVGLSLQSEAARSRSQPFTVNARKMPDEIIVPKIPEKPPRSFTWNQCAFTFTIETAAKLWKYMFAA
jgi:hypothetical protein